MPIRVRPTCLRGLYRPPHRVERRSPCRATSARCRTGCCGPRGRTTVQARVMATRNLAVHLRVWRAARPGRLPLVAGRATLGGVGWLTAHSRGKPGRPVRQSAAPAPRGVFDRSWLISNSLPANDLRPTFRASDGDRFAPSDQAKATVRTFSAGTVMTPFSLLVLSGSATTHRVDAGTCLPADAGKLGTEFSIKHRSHGRFVRHR